jgi:hypothetical protein
LTADEESPPVTVTYRLGRGWHDAHCDELGGLVISALDFETARAVAWTGLRRLKPARGVREIFEGYGG